MGLGGCIELFDWQTSRRWVGAHLEMDVRYLNLDCGRREVLMPVVACAYMLCFAFSPHHVR